MFGFHIQGITNLMVGITTYLLGSWVLNSLIAMLIGSIFIIRGIYYSVDLKDMIPSIGKFTIVKALLWISGGYGLYAIGVRVLGMAMQTFGAYAGVKNILGRLWLPLDAIEESVAKSIAGLQNSALSALYKIPIIGQPFSRLTRNDS